MRSTTSKRMQQCASIHQPDPLARKYLSWRAQRRALFTAWASMPLRTLQAQQPDLAASFERSGLGPVDRRRLQAWMTTALSLGDSRQ